jgi:hypothetical protein
MYGCNVPATANKRKNPMKQVHIFANDQLQDMATICGASGLTDYASIHNEYAIGIRRQHGKSVDILFEPISKEKMDLFLEWLNADEGQEPDDSFMYD